MATFQELEKRYYELRGMRDSGRLSDEAFRDEVGNLELQDDEGRWWSIGAESGSWYVARGGEWVKADPPQPVAPPPSRCPDCGAPLPEGARFCGSCGAKISSATPASQTAPSPQPSPAPPPPSPQRQVRPQPATSSAPVSPPLPRAVASPYQGARMNYAGVGRRAAATILDSVILSLFVGGVVGALGAYYGAMGSVQSSDLEVVYSVAGCVMSLLVFGYYIVLEAAAGGTLGKKMLGMRVVKVDGSRCGFGSSLVRNIFRIIDGLLGYLLGAIFIWSSDRNQRLGDRVAGTVVVSRR